MATVEDFAARVELERYNQYIADALKGLDKTYLEKLASDASKTVVHYGGKYARVDVGGSGKYMVIMPGYPGAGEIHGIKVYGVIHPKKIYGTLDTINEWDWGGYEAVRK